MSSLRRRLLILPAAVIPLFGRKRGDCPDPEGKIPSDAEQLNAFAGEYNAYVESLRQGVIDVKKWARVKQRWQAMTGM